MKKTLALLPILATAAFTAEASEVTLYGIIDTAVNYTHTSLKKNGHKTSTNITEMVSGQTYGSRWGLRGTEEITPDLSVGFVLENGFDSTNGANQMDRQFGRESILSVTSKTYGQISFGRVGELMSAVGSYALWGRYSNPMGGGWSSVAGSTRYALPAGLGRYDNTITVKTPQFAGFQAYGQYSINARHQSDPYWDGDRYGAAAVTFDRGPFGAVVIGKWTHKANSNAVDGNGTVIGAAANYTLPCQLKIWLAGQYMEKQNKLWDWELIDTPETKGMKGYGLSLGLSYPVASGTLAFTTGYFDGKQDGLHNGLKNDLSSWGASLGYMYNLSKRTKIYAVGGYLEHKQKLQAFAQPRYTNTKKACSISSGLVHFF